MTPLENLERKWGVGQPRSPAEMIALACANLDAQDGLDPLRIDAASRQCWSDYASGIQWFTAAFRDGRHVPFGREEVTRRFEALKSVIRQAKEGLLALLPRAIEREERDEACVRTELISAWYDRACLYGLRALQAEGCEQFCYSEVKSNGYNTRAYKVETTIQQALFDTCDCLTNEVLYNKLTSQGGFQTDIPAHISANRNDPRFPLIQKDRHVFAFSNGLYVAWLRKSLLRTPVETCGEALSIALDEGAVRDFFIPYEGGRVEKALKAEVCACKYFDHPFDEAARLSVTSGRTDWYALATPNLQQILDAQRLPEEACRWLYAFIGRMIYSVGELDGLQLIVYLKGVAGTGEFLFSEQSTTTLSDFMGMALCADTQITSVFHKVLKNLRCRISFPRETL